MDTAEKSAEILVKVLSMGGKKQTITADNFRELGKAFNVNLPEKFLK
jgi:rhamnulose-1-phosphate aldolase